MQGIYPFYLKTDVPFTEAPNCTIFKSNGDKVSAEELGIQIVFRDNGGGRIMMPDGHHVNFTPNTWANNQSKPGYFLKVDLDGNRIWMGDRKLHIADKEEVAQNSMFDLSAATDEIQTTKLHQIEFDPRLFIPLKTGKYIDKFLSKKEGLLPATNILITGDPGIGKSSTLMDILVGVKTQDPNKRVLYISAEMTKLDMEEFIKYYPGLEEIDFLFLGEYVTDPDSKFKPYQALQATLEKGWDLVVIDSLYETQSMIQEDLDINSFKKGERWMLDIMNKHNGGFNKLNLYTCFLAIQQKNKSGQYVGSKRLEHMTSGFLQLLWDAKERGKRYMIFEKNRKGKEKVKLYYNMHETKGIVYDELRHAKELEFMIMLQQTTGSDLEQLDKMDFEALFNAKPKDEE